MNETHKIPRMAVIALLGEGFFSRLSFGFLSLALPLYARQLGLTLTQVGILVSLSAVVSIFGKPLMGGIADRFGLRRTLIAGIGLRSLVTLLFALCWMPWHLFGIRALHGLADATRKPAVDALLASAGGKKAIASVFSWYSTSRAVAASVGRAGAGLLLAATVNDYTVVFVAAFVLSALPMLVAWRYVKEPEHAGPQPQPQPQPQVAPAPQPEPAGAPAADLPQPRRPGLLPIVSLGALMSGTAEMLRGLFPILAVEYAGLSPAQTGMIYLASTLVTMGAGPVFGWLSDHVSRELVLLVRSAANILSSAIYLVSPTFVGVTAARLTDDMGKAAFRPAWGALMATASSDEPRKRARKMGIMGVGEDVGELLGPIVAGLLLSSGGLVALMGTRIALAAFTEVYAIYVTRRLHAAGAAHERPASAPAASGGMVPTLQPSPAAPGASRE